jgi:hypothetical protein
MNRRDFIKSSGVVALSHGVPRGLYGRDEAASSTPEGGSSLKVGFAERDITPDIGMEMPAGYTKSYFKGFHDRCKVRAVVFNNGATRIALVGIDAGGIPRSIVEAARKKIQEQCGIPPATVLLGASHSHSSGPIMGVLPGQYDHAPALVQHLAYDMSTMADAGYIQRVEEQIAGAVSEANDTLVEARCGVGTGTENQVAFCRRLRMKNGRTYTHPGHGNPDIIGYAGPTDPQVGVIGAWDTKGRLLGCVVNFTCHATTNPGSGADISANWIYFMEQAIRGAMGTEVPVVFLQGAAGDVTQVDNLSPYRDPPGEEWAQFVGGRVGAEAAKVLWTVVRGDLTPLDVQSKVLHIKRRVPSPEHVQRAYDLVKQDINTVGATDWAFAKETVMLDALIKMEPVVEVEVQAIQIGPAVFVSNPAELFCQYGLDLKARSHFPHTYAVGYANGFLAYVPTEEAFGPHGGGYETRLTAYSNLEVTAGTQMVEAGLELVARMKPGTIPTRPKASNSHPWPYGDVPPQLD